MDVHERRQRSYRPLGRVEHSYGRVRVSEVVHVPTRAQFRGQLLGLRTPALAGIVGRVAGERERPPVAGQRTCDRRRDVGLSGSTGDQGGGHRGSLDASSRCLEGRYTAGTLPREGTWAGPPAFVLIVRRCAVGSKAPVFKAARPVFVPVALPAFRDTWPARPEGGPRAR